jgi:putative membrane protein
MELIGKLFINTLAILITAFLLPGIVVKDFMTALTVAVVLGFLNIFLKPILIFFTIPITILTLGFFIFIINALIVLLVSHFVPGFEVKNIWWAFLFSIILSIITSFLYTLSS